MSNLLRYAVLTAAVVVLFLGTAAEAAGLLAPTDRSLPPLRVTDHLVRGTIRDGVAITTVTQTFRNDTDRRLEATYVFPLPEDGDLTDFQMSFNGKMVQGKVLPAEEARTIYESIVRQARDPGLIEFIGRRLLQMRVFPIEPKSDTTIQVRYQQICRPVSGMSAYHYPLRTCRTSGRAYGTVRFDLELETTEPLKNIWSPSHSVEIVRNKNETSARIGYEANGGSLEDDFMLLYDTDAADVGLSVVAHRTSTDANGHFVLMLTPKQLWPEDQHEAQDFVFVVDTSGSMAADGKIDQAKQALRFCIDRLDERDRFSVVRFSTGFDVLFESVDEATDANKQVAGKWINAFNAAGGTNIADTLQHVMGMRPAASDDGTARPFVVVFLTDGRGNRAPEEIFSVLAKAAPDAGSTRVFTFGVGHDVNTNLLDGLAERYTGRPRYVQPGENLELVLGDFFSIVSRPVLTNLALKLPGIGVTERFPATLSDLYHGQALVVSGRYANDMKGAVTLAATRGGERVEFSWPAASFVSNADADYVPSIWAGRKIAYLIDQIRAHGENQEMLDEVLALSQAYGIQTPYSSWLVNPEGVSVPRPAVRLRAMQERALGRKAPATAARRPSGSGIGGGFGGGAGRDLEYDGLSAGEAVDAVAETSGVGANVIARRNAKLKSSRTKDDSRLQRGALAVRTFGGQTYNRIGTFLVDERFDETTTVLGTVKFASDGYFELVRLLPELRDLFASSPNIVLLLPGGEAVLVAQEDGEEGIPANVRKHLGGSVR